MELPKCNQIDKRCHPIRVTGSGHAYKIRITPLMKARWSAYAVYTKRMKEERDMQQNAMTGLQATQSINGGAVTAVTICCANCVKISHPSNQGQFSVFGGGGKLACWMTSTDPSPTTTHKKVWLCDICHKNTVYNPHPFYSSNLWVKVDIYVSVYNPHPYFTATGGVHACPNTNVTSHKLTFKPGYHIYTFCLCHIFMYTGIYFYVAVIYNEYLWVFSKLF